MAKLRANHQRNSGGSGMIPRIGIFVVLVGFLYWVFTQFSGDTTTLSEAIENVEEQFNGEGQPPRNSEVGIENYEHLFVKDDIFPTTNMGKIVKQDFYALSYVEKYEQPEWVAYALTRDHLKRNAKRTDNFRPDPKVAKASASDRDYRNSGYSRGHLVPAADMTFSPEAMSQTFYMSNMSPQVINFNGGVWRELEQSVRYWTKKFGRLYVVTGPVLTEGIREYIGGNDVAVPDLFYKVLLDIDEPEIKAIGFLIPNEVSVKPLKEYAVPIDEIERLTGIDFFSNVIKDKSLEEKLESRFNIKQWSFSERNFKQRIEKWNKR